MSPAAPSTLCTVALLGNPNTGKSTLFSALAGIRQRVGNYPGVTVEKKTGRMPYDGRSYEIVDLPGLYSLSPRSIDEQVAVDVLRGRTDCPPVDVILAIVDASNLQRNLYLVSQALDLGLPVVMALNMVDVAQRQGQTIDAGLLAARLGVPVVPVQAHRRYGIGELRSALAQAASGPRPIARVPLPATPDPLAEDPAAAEVEMRHRWAEEVVEGVVRRSGPYRPTMTDRLDRFLTHRLWGTLVLAVVMVSLFQAVFVWAEAPIAWIDVLVQHCGGWLAAAMPEGALRSLLVDGVIGGVGGLIAFLPQIAILFFFIAILEDCGYLARGAYLMDKWMARVGLSGKSFVPMLSSFACAIPGIMAARVVENHRDRLTTILAAPFLTCSARLPIYALLIAAFVPSQAYLGGLLNLRGLVLTGLYLLGIVAAVTTALVLKRTMLRGEPPLFLMELPSYKRPSLRTALYRVLERVMVFFRSAGTLILAVSILTWAAAYYPHNSPSVAENQRQSILGRLGHWIEPAVRPLGWDWRIGCAVIASFPAREVVVATLGVIFNQGEQAAQVEGADSTFQQRLKAATWEGSTRPLFNTAVALSIMVFFALCAQCVATLAVMRRETNSWRWPALAFAYMTGVAYLAALTVYQVSSWMGWA